MIVTGEIAMQLAAGISPRVAHATTPQHRHVAAPRHPSSVVVPDPILRFRGNPDHPAHDRFGFHNSTVPAKIDVVALGDSQTYGRIGKPGDAWPAALGSMTGKTVYNMGIGGWDAVDYLSILDEALARRPGTILLGLYFGNDIYGAFRAVHLNHVHEELATPGARSVVDALEKSASLMAEIDRLVLAAPSEAGEPWQTGAAARAGRATSVRRIISEHSRLYGAFRWIKDRGHAELFPAAAEAERVDRMWRRQTAWARRHPDRGMALERAHFRTVLTPAIRNMAMNLRDPRIAEGLAITLRVLERCAARCREEGVTFAVILIPTKETVFELLGGVPPHRDSLWSRVIANERVIRDHVAALLDARGIPFRDALDSLRQCLSNSIQPYPIMRDGHPNVAGHRAIARAAAELLAVIDNS